jgi:hypothetical protein
MGLDDVALAELVVTPFVADAVAPDFEQPKCTNKNTATRLRRPVIQR